MRMLLIMRPLQHLFVLVVVGLYAWEQLHPVFEVVVCVIEARMRMCDPACIARHGHPRLSYCSLSFVRRVPLSQPSFMRRVQLVICRNLRSCEGCSVSCFHLQFKL